MKKKEKTKSEAVLQAEDAVQKDDMLFEALGQKKKRKRRKIIITVVSCVLVLGLVAAVAVMLLQKRVREEFATQSGEVLSAEVTVGSISTVVSGSGSLADVELDSVVLPDGVEILEVSVKAGDAVSQGDILATVNMSSVISTMAEIQADIEELDEKLSDAEGDAADTNVYAGVSGRVKAIYAAEGDSVAEIMADKGALAVISLDGYMAVTFESTTLNAGTAVTVKREDGSEIGGTVESVFDGVATVLVSDNGPRLAEAVSVFDADGNQLGAGSLSVHSPLAVTGYAGTVQSVRVSENAAVSSGTKIFALEATEYSANYSSLLRSRGELEETLLELITIRRDGAVLSHMDGRVYSVDYSESAVTAVATLSPDKKMSVTVSVDEKDILSLELDQSVTVTVKSVSEDSFTGTLTEINRSGESGSYTAVVELDKAEGMLSGMTANVSIRIEGVDNALLIPIEALHQTANGAYVYTSYNEELQEYGGKVDVVTGLENSTYVEIKSGLQEGDAVYYTEQQSGFGGFGGMGGFGGGMPGMGGSGSGMPGMGGSGSGMPDFGGGNRPSFDGGGMPSFGGGSSGSRPSGMGGR